MWLIGQDFFDNALIFLMLLPVFSLTGVSRFDIRCDNASCCQVQIEQQRAKCHRATMNQSKLHRKGDNGYTCSHGELSKRQNNRCPYG